jgi:hypothetical protein
MFLHSFNSSPADLFGNPDAGNIANFNHSRQVQLRCVVPPDQ